MNTIAKDKTVLLTGASGRVGRQLLEFFAEQKIHLVATYSRHLPDHFKQFSDCQGITFRRLDIRNKIVMEERVDYVVHAAACISGSMEDYIDVNINGIKQILDWSISNQVEKLIFLSSVSVLGQTTDHLASEQSPLINQNAYGLSKRACELLLMEYQDEIDSVSLRLPGIIGKRIPGPWLTRVCEKCLQHEKIQISNSNDLFNQSVHVEDLANFIISLFDKKWSGNEVLHLANDDAMTVLETVQLLISETNSNSFLVDEGPKGNHYFIDDRKARNTFGFRTRPMKQIVCDLANQMRSIEYASKS